MDNSVKERLTEFIKTIGISVNRFEKEAGLATGYMRQLRKEPSPTKIKSIISAFPSLSESWLLTGEGEMLKSNDSGAEANVNIIGRPFKASSPTEGAIPVRFFHITPTATFKEFCEGMDEEPDSIPVVPPHGVDVDKDSCVFEISGESMFPLIPNKARVLCREVPASQWHQVRDGVVAIAYGDKFVIKRVLKNCLGSDNYILLGSDNPDFPAEEKAARADIRCVFRALFVLSYPIS